jgi:hypothetical protein
MQLFSKVRSIGRGTTVGVVAGLGVGLALAIPGAATPTGVLQAVMAGTGAPVPPTSTTVHPSPTTTVPPATGGHHHASSGPGPGTGPTTTKPPTSPPGGATTLPPATGGTATTAPPARGDATTTAPPAKGDGPATSTTTAAGPTCEGSITSFTVALVDGGRGIRLTVMVTGHVGWMSAYAPGVGGAALAPIDGGFAGTITGHEPIAPGTQVLVGSCHNHVRATAVVGGGVSGDAPATSTTTVAPANAAPTVTTVHSGLPAGCSTATISSVAAVLGDGGRSVTVTVLVDGSVGWMSGEVNGVGGITLQAVPGGFAGTLEAAAPIPPGTTVVVGTCGGKLRATATVSAVS